MTPPGLTFVMELRVHVGTPVEVGEVARGRRRVVSIDGGTFRGPGLEGVVESGGADWQIVRADGVTELDARYLLRTASGDRIAIRNRAVRHAPPEVLRKLLDGEAVDPSLVYFRTVPEFETPAPALQWLTRAVFIGDAERHPREVIVRVWRVD